MAKWTLALPLLLSLAGPDIAGAAEPGVGIVVSYADLDLSQQSDARRLRLRVQHATRALCTQPRQGVLASPAEILCRRSAMARAQGQIERATRLAADRSRITQTRLMAAAER